MSAEPLRNTDGHARPKHQLGIIAEIERLANSRQQREFELVPQSIETVDVFDQSAIASTTKLASRVTA